MDGTGRLGVGRQGRELIGHYPDLPCPASVGRNPHHFWRGLGFVAQAERTGFHKRRQDLGGAFARQFFRTLGALGGDDDPLLGEIVLA